RRGRPGRSLAARLPARRLDRVLPARYLVADVRRLGHRHGLVLAALPADERSAALGPRQRQERPRIFGVRAGPQRRVLAGDGDRDLTTRAKLCRTAAVTADTIGKSARGRLRRVRYVLQVRAVPLGC